MRLGMMNTYSDCRPRDESPADSVRRLRKVRAFHRDKGPREAKGASFNHLIDRTVKELTMSRAAFKAIKRVFKARSGQMTTLEGVRVILDTSRDYLSREQARELAAKYPLANDGSDEPNMRWYSFREWTEALMLEGNVCAWTKSRVHIKPERQLLGKPSWPQHYHGLDWDKDYTYVEARGHIAKALIMRMHEFVSGGPGMLTPEQERYPEFAAIINQLEDRAGLRSAALRGWARLIKLAPLIGRWSLFLKPWYLEVTLRPGCGSVWSECRERFAGMQGVPDTKRQKK